MRGIGDLSVSRGWNSFRTGEQCYRWRATVCLPRSKAPQLLSPESRQRTIKHSWLHWLRPCNGCHRWYSRRALASPILLFAGRMQRLVLWWVSDWRLLPQHSEERSKSFTMAYLAPKLNVAFLERSRDEEILPVSVLVTKPAILPVCLNSER